MRASVAYNLDRLFDFSGRETRARFWPYAGLLQLAATLAALVAITPPLFGFVGPWQKLIAALNAHPSPMPPNGYSYEPLAEFDGLLVVVIAVCALNVALAAAAVVRRLHDGNRSGWWGLLPLPFLFGGFFGLRWVLARLSTGTPDRTTILLLLFNNLIYLAAVGYLVVLLAKAGAPGANRFGVPPA